MARIQSHPILAQIRTARTYSEQTSALRSLKNEIVGHAQKKELWVGMGVLDPIVKILGASRSPAKLNGKDSRFLTASRSLSEEENARLQALQLLASFANGGPSFLEPIQAAGAVPAVLSNISPFTNPPQIVVSALRVLVNITDALSLSETSIVESQVLAESMFASLHIESLNNILSITSTNSTIQAQVALVATLISRLCHDEKHQFELANSGILDSLATRLAGFVVAEGQVIPGAELSGRADGLSEFIPGPAPQGANLAVILEAISTIISDSRFRACMLLCSPAILAVFPAIKFTPTRAARAPWNSLELSGLGHMRQQSLSAMDYLLPPIPVHQSRHVHSHPPPFPPLGATDARDSAYPFSRTSSSKFVSGITGWDASRFEPFNQSSDPDSDEHESPLIPWLIHLVRTRTGLDRLMAAAVLTPLVKAGFGSKYTRETSLGLLVIPVLVEMLSDFDSRISFADPPLIDASTSLIWTIVERTPAVLAKLITDSELLQKAAFDCGAVKLFSLLFLNAYLPVPSSTFAPTWSPQVDGGLDQEINSPVCRLGQEGLSPLLAHRLRMRESSLKAIGALAAGKDEYRKAFVDLDIVSYIVKSLSQSPSEPSNSKERAKPDAPDGHVADPSSVDSKARYGTNPLSVVIAACHAIRMMSRSVSILRTTLVDFAVAIPLFRFLRHPDVDAQIAATAAMCNLVTEVSPMREMLAEMGVLKILCEHAHSLNPSLRLNALWALKHFVHAVAPEVKKQCLEELESGWLVQLICDDTEDDALFSARAKSEKHTGADTGDDLDGDVEMDQTDEQMKSWFGSVTPPQDFDGKRTPRVRQAEVKLAALRETELNPLRKARNDDLAIQEQGLDFIRNLIGAAGSATGSESSSETTEMIDYLFNELGQDRLFEILAKKLQAKVLHPFSRRSASNGREARVLYPQAKIIEAVIFILVHMAASIPRHRQLVIAQTDLLKLLGNHFNSKDKEVRVALCHLISNLTWQDDLSDARSCAQRAHELKKLGFLTKLEALEEDSELDVRERAKNAAWQMKQFSY